MSKTIKQPSVKGVVKVPVIMQLEALECGAACLTMIAAYYGKWLPLEQVRTDCGVSRDGSKAVNLLKAARHYGFQADGYRYSVEALHTQGQFPCIIHWNFNHFIVCDGFKGNKVYLNDPAKGNYSVSMEVFDEAFTGICLMFEPGEDFHPSGKKKNPFRSEWAFSESVLAFASCFSFLLALYAGLFIMLTLASLSQNTGACTLALKPLQSAFQGFIFADAYLRHCYPSPRSLNLFSVFTKV